MAKTEQPRAQAPSSRAGNWRRGARAFKPQRADFYEDLAAALDDRAVLTDELAKYQSRVRAKRPALAALFGLWSARMNTMSFTSALAGTVPTLDSIILSAAETGNKLSDGLRYTSNLIRNLDELRRAIMGAIFVPSLLLAMITGMLIGYAVFLVPILVSIMPPKTWPFLGRLMYGVSEIVVNQGPYIALGVGALGAAVVASLSRWTGSGRLRAERILPVYPVYRDYYGAIFLVSIAALMQSNVSLVDALNSVKKSANPWLRWHINRILRALDHEAGNPAKAFNTGLFSTELYFRISDYGERSSFPTALSKVGNQVVKRVGDSVKRRAAMLNLVLLLVCGSTLGLMISSVMLTAQEAQSGIRAQAVRVK